MPTHLPPAPIVLSSDVLSDHARQALGTSGQTLSAAYQRAAQAMGVTCLGVNILAVQGDLPPGLHALLSRHNPALASVAKPGNGVRFVYAKPSPEAQKALENTDRQALSWLVSQGLLEAMPGNQVVDTGQGGLTRIMPGYPNRSQISLDPDVRQVMVSDTLPFSDRLDPVMFRWLSLFHEAGHAQRAMDDAAFSLAGLSPTQESAINTLLRGPTAHQGSMGETFDESYADAFAVLSLLRLTHGSPSAWAVVNYLGQSRRDSQLHPKLADFDPHASHASLDRLLADLHAHPERMAQIEASPPAQIRQWAGQYASWGTWRWAQEKKTSDPALGWTLVVPDLTETPTNQAILASAFFQVQDEKLTAYLRSRIAIYATTPKDQSVAVPVTDGDPLLDSLAAQDAFFRKKFDASGTVENHKVAAKILNAPPFGDAGQKVLDHAFNQLPEVAKVRILMLAHASAYFGEDANVTSESDFQSGKGRRAMAGLSQIENEVDPWSLSAPGIPAVASVRRFRR